MASRGIVIVAFSAMFDRLAAQTMKLSREHTTLPIHVITNVDESNRSPAWKHIPDVSTTYLDMPSEDNRVPKTQLYRYTPFDETLYIDCDSVIQHHGIERVFDQLQEHGLVLQPFRLWRKRDNVLALYLRAMRISGERLPLQVYYGTILLFNKADAMVPQIFDRWHYTWIAHGRKREQPALACTMKFFLRRYNYRPGVFSAHIFSNAANTAAVVQHDYPGHSRAALSFKHKFKLPAWKTSSKIELTSQQWERCTEASLLPSALRLPADVTSKCDDDAVCMTAFVFGNYLEFIPVFILSCSVAYPEYFTKVFVPADALPDNIRRSLDLIREHQTARFDVVTGRRPSAIIHKHSRWMLQSHDFEGFDRAYIGDVDFIITRETPTLGEFHDSHCKALGYPFSNQRRYSASDRVSGLHYIQTKSYFSRMDPIITEYSALTDLGVSDLDAKPGWNERLLARMLETAGWPPPRAESLQDFRKQQPHHGLHLGLLRSHSAATHAYSKLYWPRLCCSARDTTGHELYDSILKHTTSHTVYKQLVNAKKYVLDQVQTTITLQPVRSVLKPAKRRSSISSLPRRILKATGRRGRLKNIRGQRRTAIQMRRHESPATPQ